MGGLFMLLMSPKEHPWEKHWEKNWNPNKFNSSEKYVLFVAGGLPGKVA
jgi:hypothetical protein